MQTNKPSWMHHNPRQRCRDTHKDASHSVRLTAVLDCAEQRLALWQVRQRLGIKRIAATKSLLRDLGLFGEHGRWHEDLDARVTAYREVME